MGVRLGDWSRKQRIIMLILLTCNLTACEVEFTPHVSPAWSDQELSPFRMLVIKDPCHFGEDGFEIIDNPTEEDLEYCSQLLGFGQGDNPTLDQAFDPYFVQDPATGEPVPPSQALMDASLHLYWSEGDPAALMRLDPNNPLNFWETDPEHGYKPLTILEGEERQAMAGYMTANLGNTPITIFLKLVRADPELNWNHEPCWVYALQEANRDELRNAKRKFLNAYASDPDIYEFMQVAEPTGGEPLPLGD